MLKAKLYNLEGKETGEIKLPEGVFGVEMVNDLVHQVVVAQAANSRKVIADTKDRGEVRGGGKKPWKQKGTGRARAGSIRSPIWKGGGVTFGPTTERNYSKKINKKMKQKALFMILSAKLKDNEIIFVDEMKLKEAKTKEMKKALGNLLKVCKVHKVKSSKGKSFENEEKKKMSKRAESVLVALDKKNDDVVKAAANIPRAKIVLTNSLNVLDLLNHKYILMAEKGVGVIEETFKKVHKGKSL